MRIAVISTIYRPTPPKGYGGIERVVHTLVDQLVKSNHQVTLFAAPGSYCSGKTIEVKSKYSSDRQTRVRSARDMPSEEPLYNALKEFLTHSEVDVIHDWSLQNLFVRRHPDQIPSIISTCIPPAPNYKRSNLVACSKAHADLIGPTTRYVRYGLNLNDWQFNFEKKSDFIHIAKIARYKGQHLAVLAAKQTKSKLILAGNIEDKLYYNFFLWPLIRFSHLVQHIGEINGTGLYLQKAKALIQTPKWFDAFPLIVLEALASGTPVIAFGKGGIPEQIVNGVNGFLCSNRHDLADAMENINEIKPQICREYAEEHFSVQRMAQDYIRLYSAVIDGEKW